MGNSSTEHEQFVLDAIAMDKAYLRGDLRSWIDGKIAREREQFLGTQNGSDNQ